MTTAAPLPTDGPAGWLAAAARLLVAAGVAGTAGIAALGTYAAALGLAGGLAALATAVPAQPPGRRRERALWGWLAAALVAAANAAQPWFWVVAGAAALPLAWPAPRPETSRAAAMVALLELALAALWCQHGHGALVWLAAVPLAAQSAGVLATTWAGDAAAPAAASPRPVALVGRVVHDLLAAAELLLVYLLFGAAPAGLYALASRLAATCLLPAAPLARRFGQRRPQAATATVLLLAALGLLGGPWLCSAFGPDGGDAAPAFGLLLLARLVQQLGTARLQTLANGDRDLAHAACLAGPGALQLALWLACGQLRFGMPTAAAATVAALLAATAQLAVAAGCRLGLGAAAGTAQPAAPNRR